MKTFFFFFFLESTCALCPWSLALASSIPVLGLESVCPRKGCPWPWPRIFFVSLALALASSHVSSTPPLIFSVKIQKLDFAAPLNSLGPHTRDGADNKKCIRMLHCVRKPCPHAAPHRIQTQLSSRCTAPHRKLNIH